MAFLEQRYPPAWAQSWDRVGLVLGEPSAPVRTVLLVIDCVPETVAEAVALGADLIVAHHPLLLRGVASVAPTTYKGRIVHRLIKADIALFTAHTNADVAAPGVSDALAARLGLASLRPLVPAADDPRRGTGRVGVLSSPVVLAEFADAVRAGVDAYLTADLRHHPASEHLADGGPALVDAAHWATEHPWLDELAAELLAGLGMRAVVSTLDTDPWTLHLPTNDQKEPRP